MSSVLILSLLILAPSALSARIAQFLPTRNVDFGFSCFDVVAGLTTLSLDVDLEFRNALFGL